MIFCFTTHVSIHYNCCCYYIIIIIIIIIITIIIIIIIKFLTSQLQLGNIHLSWDM